MFKNLRIYPLIGEEIRYNSDFFHFRLFIQMHSVRKNNILPLNSIQIRQREFSLYIAVKNGHCRNISIPLEHNKTSFIITQYVN